jgi:hypothetical protein
MLLKARGRQEFAYATNILATLGGDRNIGFHSTYSG